MAGRVGILLSCAFHIWVGKTCPCCGKRTTRAQTPWFFRPLRILSPRHTSTRFCNHCGWWALAFHR